MKPITKLLFVILIALPVLTAQAAPPGGSGPVPRTSGHACPEIVQQAWQNLNELCQQTGRNKACYGHVLLKAQPQPFVADFGFSAEGDVVDVASLKSLQLSAMDLVNGYWGVALMRVQANLPADAPDKNVALLLFGDVQITDASAAPATTVTVTNPAAYRTLNIRYRPSTAARVVGTLRPGETAVATGQVVGGAWLRVVLDKDGQTGWVFAPLVTPVDPAQTLANLAVVGSGAQAFGPMQAFYLQSGVDDAACPEAPNSGLLVQTPEGVAEVTLLINSVEVRLGSTVLFQAQPGAEATITVVEGHARVTAAGSSQVAPAGTQITVPLGADLTPAGPPSPPVAYDLEKLAALPVAYLTRSVVVAPPLAPEELQAAITLVLTQEAEAEAEAEALAAATEEPVVATEDELPPGLVDNPGLGEDLPPGHGGEPPGRTDKHKP